MDPGAFEPRGDGGLEFVTPYTDWRLTNAVLERVGTLVRGLDATVKLVAVHTSPYPAPMASSIPPHAYLVEQLAGLAEKRPFTVKPQVVLARYWDEGFRYVLSPRSTVLMGTWKRPWRTREEKMARALVAEGRDVTLLRIEPRAAAAPPRGWGLGVRSWGKDAATPRALVE
jgi:hypothetical protein